MSFRALIRSAVVVALIATTAAPAMAALDLSTYSVALQTGLDFDEASGVAFNYDKNVLFVIDDEGDDAAEFSLAGLKLTADKFQSNYRDLEGVTYIGNGQYVMADERTETLALIQAVTTGTIGGLPSTVYTGTSQARKYAINGGANIGNNGLEGVAYDPSTGQFFGVRQGGGGGITQAVYQVGVTFGTPTTGTTSQPFDPASLGLGTLSDVAVLAADPNLAQTDYYTNLLLLSLGSRKLVEVTRTGQLLSSFDLSGLQIQTIEGVTLDRSGNIYLVGETGGVTPGDASTSGLVVLSRTAAAVPEPASWAMLIAGFGLVGGMARRRRSVTATA
jgi:hypothetical protein